MIGKAIKNPVEVDWFRWNNGSYLQLNKWVKSLGDSVHDHFIYYQEDDKNMTVKLQIGSIEAIGSFEGNVYDVPNDSFIIKKLNGYYRSYSLEEFREQYTIVL